MQETVLPFLTEPFKPNFVFYVPHGECYSMVLRFFFYENEAALSFNINFMSVVILFLLQSEVSIRFSNKLA